VGIKPPQQAFGQRCSSVTRTAGLSTDPVKSGDYYYARWPGGAPMAVTLSFDDGYAATLDATLPILHEREMRATFNAITGCVGATFEGLPTATWAQWGQVVGMGHEVASHSTRHVPLAGPYSDLRRLWKGLRCAPDRRTFMRHSVAVTAALARRRSRNGRAPAPRRSTLTQELAASRSVIQRALGGARAESFAYPAGRHSRHARQAVAAAGFSSARTLDRGWNQVGSDFFALRAVGPMPGETPRDLERWLEETRAHSGWLIIVLHLVAPGNPTAYPYFWSVDAFRRLLDHIGSQQCWVVTQHQAVRYLAQWHAERPAV
jgi:peptidoglycan/xylan/chitin deacetylase (PgdA/CDA1 family)